MRGIVVVATVIGALAGTAPASAALPSAGTGGAKDITQSSALLTGTVNPNGAPTTYYFQYGTTKSYGSQTPTQGPTAADNKTVAASATIDGLSPATTYHYRLVAVNASGTKTGGDKSFKTKATPAVITLSAAPGKIVYGRSTTLSGQLTPQPGKPAAGVRITLQQDGAPFNPSDFKAAATAKTDANGRFSFVQNPLLNTAYRVTAATNPRATSNTAIVRVANAVTLFVSGTHPKRGHRVVFSGLVAPAHTGALVRIQRRVGTRWRTVKSGVLTAGPTATQSAFRVAVRVRRRGYYRAYVGSDVANVAGASRRRLISPRG